MMQRRPIFRQTEEPSVVGCVCVCAFPRNLGFIKGQKQLMTLEICVGWNRNLSAMSGLKTGDVNQKQQ
jgi:hypothetical protein